MQLLCQKLYILTTRGRFVVSQATVSGLLVWKRTWSDFYQERFCAPPALEAH